MDNWRYVDAENETLRYRLKEEKQAAREIRNILLRPGHFTKEYKAEIMAQLEKIYGEKGK